MYVICTYIACVCNFSDICMHVRYNLIKKNTLKTNFWLTQTSFLYSPVWFAVVLYMYYYILIRRTSDDEKYFCCSPKVHLNEVCLYACSLSSLSVVAVVHINYPLLYICQNLQ